jgi:hypothetical protein
MSDGELDEWFNQQIAARKGDSSDAQATLNSLQLFRNALLREVKRPKPKSKRRRASSAKR